MISLRLGLHPGGHEGRQVALRDAVEDHLLADQPLRGDRRHPLGGDLVVGGSLDQPLAAESLPQLLEGFFIRHISLLLGSLAQPY